MSFISCFIVFNICVIAAYTTYYLMSMVSKKEGLTDYSLLVERVLGRKMSIFLNVLIIIFMVGSFIAYQINSNLKQLNHNLTLII